MRGGTRNSLVFLNTLSALRPISGALREHTLKAVACRRKFQASEMFDHSSGTSTKLSRHVRNRAGCVTADRVILAMKTSMDDDEWTCTSIECYYRHTRLDEQRDTRYNRSQTQDAGCDAKHWPYNTVHCPEQMQRMRGKRRTMHMDMGKWEVVWVYLGPKCANEDGSAGEGNGEKRCRRRGRLRRKKYEWGVGNACELSYR